MLGITADITERKRAEVELNAERRLINTLFDQLPVGVLFCEPDGKYRRANRTTAELLGMSEEKIIGMGAEELYAQLNAKQTDGTNVDPQDISSNVSIKTGEATGWREIRISTPEGERKRVSTSAAPMIDQEGTLYGSVTVMSDVTEQYLLEEQLRQSQKMESVGTLAGGVAHDFNNLLTAILGNTQLAMRGQSGESKLFTRLVEIEKAASRASSLTRQLLAFSRRQRLLRKTINLNDTIHEITRMLSRIIGEDVKIHVEASLDISPIFADPAQIEQVIMNLAVNARDAMPEGGQLVLKTRNVTLDEAYKREHPHATPGKYVMLSVVDTGKGMDAETRKRIFEPFFTTKEAGHGTGLGLSMAYGIVKQHDGLIEVYSEVGHGTSFNLYFPIDTRSAVEAKQELLPTLRGGTETI